MSVLLPRDALLDGIENSGTCLDKKYLCRDCTNCFAGECRTDYATYGKLMCPSVLATSPSMLPTLHRRCSVFFRNRFPRRWCADRCREWSGANSASTLQGTMAKAYPKIRRVSLTLGSSLHGLLLSILWIAGAACFLGLTGVVVSPSAFAQDAAPQGPTDGYEGLSISALTVSPQTRPVPGGVLIIRCEVSNSGKSPAIGYLVGRITGQTGDEDRRRIELSGGETKSYDMQLRLANTLPNPNVDVVMTLNVLQGDREVMVQRGDQPVKRTLTLQVPQESNITAIAMNPEPPVSVYWRWPDTPPYFTYEFAVASRVDAMFSRRCVVLDSEPLPLNLADWKSINLLIVASPVVFEDAANIAVMQQYLYGGGRVWVMLDAIDTEAIGDLLPENCQIETVETVELNRFEIDIATNAFASQDRMIDRDDSVQMKRVIHQGGEVTQSVDGWPAAIWMQVGRGKLLLTTLSGSGWLELRKSQKSLDPVEQSTYTMPMWASGFANEIHNPKAERPLELASEKYPIDRIGNPVVSRSLVATILLAFCACLIALGLWLFFGGGLSRFGIIAPTLALVASVPLIIAATLQRRDIPTMNTALQVVQIDSVGGAYLREGAAVYSSESRGMELIGKGDGLAIPASTIETGIRSVTTDDFQNWRLTNSTWPAGTWRYRSQLAIPEIRLVAQANLTKEGLDIELPQELPSPLQDVVVNMVAGAQSLGKSLDGKKRLLIDGELPAEGDRWTTDTIVSDEQRRRAEVYTKLFEDIQEPQIPLRTLCGWTELWPQAPQWNVDIERRGTALVTLPIRIATPPAGSEVRIPYPLVGIEHADFKNASSVFKQSTGKFISEATLATDAEFAFLLPPEAVPFEAKAISIDWDVKAPSRKVRLSCLCEGGPVELAVLNSPSIPWKSTIDDPRILKDLRDGRIVLRIEISGGEELESAQTSFVSWRIKHLRLNVDGRTLPRHNLVPAQLSEAQLP